MRTALIGGASKGLGFGCAQVLAEKGYRVVMCSRNGSVLDESAETIRSQSNAANVITIPTDFSSKESLADLKQTLQDQEIDIDILVNNTGGPPPGIVTETKEEDWEKGLDLLFRSTLRLYDMVLPGMRLRKWGRIINILSTAVVEPSPGLAVSSVIRAGLACYAKLTALEVARDHVTINSIMPGAFLTARYEELENYAATRENVSTDVIRQRIAANIPIGRMMETWELGNLVAFLSSDQASVLTGLLLPMDGGQMKSI